MSFHVHPHLNSVKPTSGRGRYARAERNEVVSLSIADKQASSHREVFTTFNFLLHYKIKTEKKIEKNRKIEHKYNTGLS